MHSLRGFWRGAAWVAMVLGLGVSSIARATPCGSGTYPFPYTDVAGVGDPFCPGIMEAYVLGVTKGTTATTFSPNDPVSRLQMTTFLQRSIDQGLRRNSRRAALGQWWTPPTVSSMQAIPVGSSVGGCASDGEAIWAALPITDEVVKVEASTGQVLGRWTGATDAQHVLIAAGKVFVTGGGDAKELFVIDPTQPPGPVTVAATLPAASNGLAFDGEHLWNADQGFNRIGSVSKITPQPLPPYPVSTHSFPYTNPSGIVFDGTNIWVIDNGSQLYKLDAAGNVIQTINVGGWGLVFDGTNIWTFDQGSNRIFVVQASSGAVTAVLGASGPRGGVFDGERMLLVNSDEGFTPHLTLLKAADFSAIRVIPTGSGYGDLAGGACSDGINFWVGLHNNLLRF